MAKFFLSQALIGLTMPKMIDEVKKKIVLSFFFLNFAV